MENETKKIVEINGCKFEVDLSTARKVEDFKLGDKVKILHKQYGDSYKVHPGVIVGFEWFNVLPTITIAYLVLEYKEAKIEFLYFNEKTKDFEVSHTQNTELLIEPADVMKTMNKEIATMEAQIIEIKRKQSYFLKCFGKYFNEFTNEKLEEMMNQ